MDNAGSPLEIFRRHYEDREITARARKDGGGKVVGYISNNVPVELIRAAGLFAFHVTGSPDEDTPLALREMEPIFDGHVLSIFNRLLEGRYAFLDLLVIPRSAEVYLQLYYFVLEAKRRDPGLPLPEVCLFDILHTPYRTTGLYNRDRVEALKARLETLAAREVGEEDMLAAIEISDANRDALAGLNVLRTRNPRRLSGVDMLRAVGASTFMAPDDHTAAAHALLAAADTLPERPAAGPRLLVQGSIQDTTRFYEHVEFSGATVVADAHPFGQVWFEDPVGTDGDPIALLTRKYHLRSPSARTFPMAARNDRLLRAVEDAQVEGVIFYHEDCDDTLGWDYPTQRDLLAERGVSSVFLKQQSYRRPDEAEQRDAIAELTARIADMRAETV